MPSSPYDSWNRHGTALAGLDPAISPGKAPQRFYSTMIEAAPIEAEEFETELSPQSASRQNYPFINQSSAF
jgi:hypothetical protein